MVRKPVDPKDIRSKPLPCSWDENDITHQHRDQQVTGVYILCPWSLGQFISLDASPLEEPVSNILLGLRNYI